MNHGYNKITRKQETELIKEVLNGKTKAFNMIIKEYWPKVHALVRRMVSTNPDTVEDICQETFISAYIHLNQFDINRKLVNWLLKIASNKVMQYYNRNKQIQKLNSIKKEYIKKENTKNHDPAKIIEEKNMWDFFLSKLPEQARIVIILRHWVGFSYAEIAELLQEPIGTVRSSLHNSRAKLKKILSSVNGARTQKMEAANYAE